MLEKHYIMHKSNTDLNVYRCGIEACLPEHYWGPGVRDHYLIHLINDGKGKLLLNGSSWNLEAGDGFMVPPDVPVYWQADSNHPWSYAWVGFHGLLSAKALERAGLGIESPIFRSHGDILLAESLNELLLAARNEEAGNMTASGELMLTGRLYIFLSRLIALSPATSFTRGKEADKDNYVKRAMEYLSRHYAERISIQGMSADLGLDRSYLSTLISKTTGMSPQSHLNDIRLSRAEFLMSNRQLSVGDIARSVGYEDPAHFSKAFRQKYGMPPTLFRRQAL